MQRIRVRGDISRMAPGCCSAVCWGGTVWPAEGKLWRGSTSRACVVVNGVTNQQ